MKFKITEDFNTKYKVRIILWFPFRYRPGKLSVKEKEKVVRTYRKVGARELEVIRSYQVGNRSWIVGRGGKGIRRGGEGRDR